MEARLRVMKENRARGLGIQQRTRGNEKIGRRARAAALRKTTERMMRHKDDGAVPDFRLAMRAAPIDKSAHDAKPGLVGRRRLVDHSVERGV